MIGNLLGDRHQEARMGDPVEAVLGPHDDAGLPEDKWTNESGWVDLWAPPRGYAVYVPK